MIFPVPFLNRGIFVDPAAKAIIDAMTAAGATPSAGYQTIINSTVLAMKANGEWSRTYVLYHFAAEAEAQALINWINPGTFTLTKAGTVNFAANQGFTPSGATADGLTSTFNLATAGAGTNDVAIELYSRTNPTSSNSRIDWGGLTSSAIFGRIRLTTDNSQARINSTAFVAGASGTVTDSSGLFSWLRNSTGIMQICRNGVQVGADLTITDQPAASQSFVWGNGVVGTNNSTTKQLAYGRICRAMSVATCLSNYNNVTLPLLQWNGANV